MTWPQSLTKMLGIHFGNSILDNFDWDKINGQIHRKIIFGTGTECDSLGEENI